MALIGELIPEHHVGKGIGVLGVAYTAGVTLGPLISGFIEVRYGWSWFFFFLAAPSLIAGILYGASSNSHPREKRQQASTLDLLPILKEALFQPGVLYLSFAAFSFFIAYIGLMTFTADHLSSNLHLPSDKLGLLLSIVGFSGIIVSPIAGFLGDRLGRIRVCLAGTGIALFCIALMAALEYAYGPYLILFLLFGTGAATTWTSLNTMAVQISPILRKPVTSLYNAIKFAGYACSPVLLSVLYGPFHLRAVLWGCMAAILIASSLAFMAEARSRKTPLPSLPSEGDVS
jgi:predicted MFS family arabinose efflux permease